MTKLYWEWTWFRNFWRIRFYVVTWHECGKVTWLGPLGWSKN